MVLLVTITTAGFKISIVRETSENYIHATPYCGVRLSTNVGREGLWRGPPFPAEGSLLEEKTVFQWNFCITGSRVKPLGHSGT